MMRVRKKRQEIGNVRSSAATQPWKRVLRSFALVIVVLVGLGSIVATSGGGGGSSSSSGGTVTGSGS